MTTQDNSSQNKPEQTDFPLPIMESESPAPDFPLSITMGEALPAGTPPASKEAIVSALCAVLDPELMLNIYELGLIYDIQQHPNGDVTVLMTLTSPTCPMAGEMPAMAAAAVSSVTGVGKVTVSLTFDPPWTPEKMSEDLRLMMGF